MFFFADERMSHVYLNKKQNYESYYDQIRLGTNSYECLNSEDIEDIEGEGKKKDGEKN